MATLNFNAALVEPSSGSVCLPADWYIAAIDESDIKPTSGGNGHFLQLRYVILDGKYKGQKVYCRLNVDNPNAQTKEIAYKQLSAICHAVNMLQVGDSQQLHNLPMKIKLKVRAATAEYEATNDITGFKNVNEETGVASAAAATLVAPSFPAAAQPMSFPAQAQPMQTQPVQQPQQFSQAAQPWAQPGVAAAPVTAQPVQYAQQPQPVAQPMQTQPVQAQPVQAQPMGTPPQWANPAAAASAANPPWANQPQQ